MAQINRSARTTAIALTILSFLLLAGCDKAQPTQDQDPKQGGGKIALVPPAGDSLLFSMAYSPDGKLVAVASYKVNTSSGGIWRPLDPYIGIYDAKTGTLIRKIPGQLYPVEFNALSDRLLVQENLSATIVDVNTGARVFTVDQQAARFTHAGDRLVVQRLLPNEYTTTGFDIYSAASGSLLNSFDITPASFDVLCISPDDRFAIVDHKGGYRIDLETGFTGHPYNFPTGQSNGTSPNGEIVAMSHWLPQIATTFYSTLTGEILSTVERPNDVSQSTAVSNDEHFVSFDETGSRNYDTLLRCVRDGSAVKTLDQVNDRPVFATFASDSKSVAVSSTHHVTVYDLK